MLFALSLTATVLGLLASWGVSRRRGAASGMRGAAWSLVPMGFYLTGLTAFLSGLVFSPLKWAGVVVLGLAGVLYLVSGVSLRTPRAARAPRETGPSRARQVPGPAAPPAKADDDMADIEEILRRRGIS